MKRRRSLGVKIAFVVDRKVAERAGVGIILWDNGIEIVIGHAAAGACAENIFVPSVLRFDESARGVKTASGKNSLSVQTRLRILKGVDFDDSAHFAAIFGGNTRGIDAHGLDVVGLNFRAKTGRAVVGEGNAIDDELGLIFRAARMQNSIAFVEPAGLGIDEVLQRASGDGTETVLELIRAKLTDGAGLVRIDKDIGGVDFHGLGYRVETELDGVLQGECGMDVE